MKMKIKKITKWIVFAATATTITYHPVKVAAVLLCVVSMAAAFITWGMLCLFSRWVGDDTNSRGGGQI